MGTLQVGIAGFGLVGQQRARCIHANPHASLVAVAEVREDYIKMVPTGVKVFNNPLSMVDEAKLDVLIVTLPQHLATAVICHALGRGCHVFAETPAARTPTEFAEVLETAKRSSKVLQFGCTHRFQKSIRDAKAVIDSGNLGSIISVDGVYGKSELIHYTKGWRTERDKAGGGILMDQGIHLIDVVRSLVGDLDVVSSIVDSSYFKHDVEDSVHALLRAKSGAPVSLRASAMLWSHEFRLDINMTDGYVRVTGILEMNKVFEQERLVITRRYHQKGRLPAEDMTIYTDGGENEAWQAESDVFIKAIVEKTSPSEGSVQDAAKNIELVHKIYSSATKNGGTVRQAK